MELNKLLESMGLQSTPSTRLEATYLPEMDILLCSVSDEPAVSVMTKDPHIDLLFGGPEGERLIGIKINSCRKIFSTPVMAALGKSRE